MDQDAFIRLFLRHEPDLKAFVSSVVRDWNRTDDILQEVSLVLWRKIGGYDPAYSFGAWARGIAAMEILKDRSRWQRAMPTLSPEAIAAVQGAFDDTEDAASPRLEAIQLCMEHLDERSRRLVDLRYREDLPLEDIAHRTERSLAAVGKALLRLRAALERCVQVRAAQLESKNP
jgi:RNA polymerase sigma-70 factor, ECF subfamily